MPPSTRALAALGDQSIAVDASISIAALPQHAQDADTLLRCTDVAKYQAKRSGAGRPTGSKRLEINEA